MNTEIRMGEIAIASTEDILTATGIGSCVVITLWEPQLRIGTLAHAMLPTRNPGNPGPNKQKGIFQNTNLRDQDTRYVEPAINEMLKKMVPLGVKRENIEAKIIGGANMFSAFQSDIGSENVKSAKFKLKEEGIKIIGACVGGSQGRSVEFSVASGIVSVKTNF